MVQVSYPGVYVQEVSSGSRTITGVSTSIAMFIGRTERGVMNVPTRLFNFTEFGRAFGGEGGKSELATSVRMFFNNGGTQAYVMRIAKGATSASVRLRDKGDAATLQVTAREQGKRGNNIRVAIDYNTANPASTFNMTVFWVDPATLQESDVEVHSNLSMTPGSARYVEDVIAQNSALVTATKLGLPSNVHGSVTGARVLTGPDASDGDDLLLDLLGNAKWYIRYEVDGEILEADFINGNFDPALQGVSVSTVPAGPGNAFLVKLTADTATTVRVLPSGYTNDIATKLQMTPELGAIEAHFNADRRPMPSGVLLDGYTNILAVAGLAGALAPVFTVDGIGIPTGTTGPSELGDLYYDGSGSSDPSLLNVQARFNSLAAQFNTAALNKPNFNWRLEVQGYNLVLRPTAGDANTGRLALVVAAGLVGPGPMVLENDNVRYYSVKDGGLGFQTLGTPGDDGEAPDINTYKDAYDVIRRDVDLFNLLILPKDFEILDSERRTFWGPASVFCQQQRAFLLVDPPETWKTLADITADIGALRTGMVKDHAGLYFPRILATVNGFTKPVDPSGAVAGIMARTDAIRGIWKAPAGLEADFRAVSGIERNISNDENGITNALAINTNRVFPDGIVVWGSRTMAGFDNSSEGDYKYVSVRRLALFLAESLARGLKFAVFEPNDEPLWAQIRLAAGAFMNNLFRQGAFAGQKKSDAYFVKVDNETTTQNDINLGIVNVIVGFAPLKPAEFVVVTIKQLAGQVQV